MFSGLILDASMFLICKFFLLFCRRLWLSWWGRPSAALFFPTVLIAAWCASGARLGQTLSRHATWVFLWGINIILFGRQNRISACKTSAGHGGWTSKTITGYYSYLRSSLPVWWRWIELKTFFVHCICMYICYMLTY